MTRCRRPQQPLAQGLLRCCVIRDPPPANGDTCPSNASRQCSSSRQQGSAANGVNFLADAVPARLPAAWPTDGAIEVQSLVVRYRADLDPVLDGISFAIKGAEQSLWR